MKTDQSHVNLSSDKITIRLKGRITATMNTFSSILKNIKVFMMDETKRPIPTLIICTLGFIESLLVILSIYTMPDQLIDSWYPPFLILSSLIIMACMIAFWHMKNWAIYFYTAFTIINQMLLFHMGAESKYSFIIPAIILILGWLPMKNTKKQFM